MKWTISCSKTLKNLLFPGLGCIAEKQCVSGAILAVLSAINVGMLAILWILSLTAPLSVSAQVAVVVFVIEYVLLQIFMPDLTKFSSKKLSGILQVLYVLIVLCVLLPAGLLQARQHLVWIYALQPTGDVYVVYKKAILTKKTYESAQYIAYRNDSAQVKIRQVTSFENDIYTISDDNTSLQLNKSEITGVAYPKR